MDETKDALTMLRERLGEGAYFYHGDARQQARTASGASAGEVLACDKDGNAHGIGQTEWQALCDIPKGGR